jgi:hypothetical protein
MWFWTEFHPVFPFSLASPLSQLATCIFTGPPCKATIINLELCTSSDLTKFPYFMDTSVRRVWGWKEAQRQGDFTDNFSIYTYTSQNIYTGLV